MPIITNKASATYTQSGITLIPTESNTVSLSVVGTDLNIVKEQDKQACKVGDVVSYTINVGNTSSVPITSVLVRDILNSGLILVPGSLKVNNVANSGDLETGILIDTIAPKSAVVITFQATTV